MAEATGDGEPERMLCVVTDVFRVTGVGTCLAGAVLAGRVRPGETYEIETVTGPRTAECTWVGRFTKLPAPLLPSVGLGFAELDPSDVATGAEVRSIATTDRPPRV
jgi:hypothetical protein